MFDGVSPHVGDAATAEVTTASTINTDADKAVEAIGKMVTLKRVARRLCCWVLVRCNLAKSSG